MSATQHQHRDLLSPGRLRAAVGVERKAALEELAARNYRSVSAEIRMAIDGHLASLGSSQTIPLEKRAL